MRDAIQVLRSNWNWTAFAVTVLLAFALMFGGASRLHELRLALVEVAAIPTLVIGLTSLMSRGEGAPSRFSLAILGLIAALPIVQLVPLPPELWTRLPGREQLSIALEISGLQAGWASLSLTPDKTWRAFLALTPPVAAFLGVTFCPPKYRLRLVFGILAFATASILLGAVQSASSNDALYQWPTTSSGTVVGFFANRNHLATLVLLSLPFAAVLGARGLRRNDRHGQLHLWLAVLFIGLATVAIGVIRSRMGIALLGPTLGASLLAAWVASGRGRPKPLLLGMIGATAVAVGAIGIFALGPLMSRFDTAGAAEGRFENWPVVAEAANAYLPFGSGLGSFDPVFRSVEPLQRLDATFFNQAHNDYLEIWLETGWFGIALIIAFLVWAARRSWSAWKARATTDRDLQRAASVAIGVILAHSAVDYPIRTETIAVLFAVCCALLDMASRTDETLQTGAPARRRRR